jgi:hypothetical protein
MQQWCNEFEKMKRLEKVPPIRQRCFIAAIHEYAGDGKSFCWRKNILSAKKFRAQYNNGQLNDFENRAREIYEANK